MSRSTIAGLLTTALIVTTSAVAPVTAWAQTKTVRMWTFLNPAGTAPREVALARIIKEFEATNPGTTIKVETQPFDQMSPKFLAAHGAGNAPDVIWVIPDFLGDAIKSGALTDLNPLFIAKWSPQQVADRAGAHWDLTLVNGKQHALFTSRNYIALMYRTDLFAAAGIDPKTLTTWDAFLEAARKLTEKNASGQVSRYGFAQGFSEQQAEANMMMPMMLASTDAPFTKEGKANFASPAGIKAMNFQADLIRKAGVQSPQSATWTLDDVYEQFAAGRVAMILGASARMSSLQAKLGKDKVGLMLWPGDGAKPHSPAVMAGWAVGVWSGSKVKQEAGKFVEHMLGEESDKIWVAVGGQSPSLGSTLGAMGDFADQPGNAYLRVAAEGFANHGWLTPVDYSVGGYRQVLNKAAQRVLVDNMDAQASLKQAKAEFNRQHGR